MRHEAKDSGFPEQWKSRQKKSIEQLDLVERLWTVTTTNSHTQASRGCRKKWADCRSLHWRFVTSWRPLWNQVRVPPGWQELRREGPGHFIGIQHLYRDGSNYRCNVYYLEGYEPSLQVISWPCFTDLVFKAFIFAGHRNPVPFLLSIKECACIKMQPGLGYTGVTPKLC